MDLEKLFESCRNLCELHGMGMMDPNADGDRPTPDPDLIVWRIIGPAGWRANVGLSKLELESCIDAEGLALIRTQHSIDEIKQQHEATRPRRV